MVHDLKIQPEFFESVSLGIKTFEIRKLDRKYGFGDLLILHEWDGDYTGRYVEVRIVYMTTYKQQADYIVLGIEKVKKRGD
ncbi:DUF3850 domain-containing protein [Bacillus haynesii]|uniref:DUF3850 domain-containing protein n=1 Tax=Bacillus haynesii TaxID=1925021 RepID=UPI00227E09B1|nr:DUF3850 domain-containing protein [Bacillus haynesii]MCY8648937.1 DUF3850 domain-containing protein [Bacillus haynesii]